MYSVSLCRASPSVKQTERRNVNSPKGSIQDEFVLHLLPGLGILLRSQFAVLRWSRKWVVGSVGWDSL